MHMPEMDGFAVVLRVRKRPGLSNTIIILLTSAGQRGDALRCRDLDVAAYLLKPVRQTELHEAIARVMGARGTNRYGPADYAIFAAGRARPRRNTTKILLAEDNAVNQKAGLAAARKRGYHVTVTTNGVEAIRATEERLSIWS